MQPTSFNRLMTFSKNLGRISALSLDDQVSIFLDGLRSIADADDIYMLIGRRQQGNRAKDALEQQLGWQVVRIYAQPIPGKASYVAREVYYELYDDHGEIDPLTEACLATTGADRLLAMRDLPVADDHWFVNEYLAELGLADQLNAIKHINADTEIYTVISRSRAKQAFSVDDKALIEAAVHLAERMFYLVALSFCIHDSGTELLTPRERDVLMRLLLGDSDNAAAKALEISPHTLRGYTKSLYRKFSVAGRNELMTLWL